MKENCYDLSVADVKLRIIADFELSFDDNMKVFFSDFEAPDLTYIVSEYDNPELIVPPSAKRIFSGSGMDVFRNDGAVYRKYYYGGEASLVLTSENASVSKVFVCGENISTNIQKSLLLETKILDFYGVFLHSSLVKHGNRTFLFTAPSGTGKSTQAELWKKHRGAEILNGDRSVLRRTDGNWLAYGSPWAGSSGIYINKKSPLTAIFVIRQAKENRLSRISGTVAFRNVLNGEILPYWDTSYMNKACEITEKLVSEIPVFRFGCTPDTSAIEALEAMLSKEGIL